MGTGKCNTVHVNGTAETEGLCEAVPATINGNQQTSADLTVTAFVTCTC